ncbi:Hpt domain-containing protein [Acetobacteraceae bacterium H6797]|nr:Hpt domain-containing protein [Acetobacteraceae bacterium H6797]
MIDDDALWQEFAGESEEHLDSIEHLLTLGRGLEREEVNTLFRAFHSLKGMSDALGASGMKTIAHVAEDFLGLVRNGKRSIDNAAADTLLAAVDGLRRLRKAVIETHRASPAPSALLDKLRKLSDQDVAPVAPMATASRESPQTQGGVGVAPALLASLASQVAMVMPGLAKGSGTRLQEALEVAATAEMLGLDALAASLRDVAKATGPMNYLSEFGLLRRRLAALEVLSGEVAGADIQPSYGSDILAPPLAALAVEVEALAAGQGDTAQLSHEAKQLAAAASALGLSDLESLLLGLEDLSDRAADPDAAASLATQGPGMADRLRRLAEGGMTTGRGADQAEGIVGESDPRVPEGFAGALSADALRRLGAALEAGQALFRAQLALGQSAEIEHALGDLLRREAEVLGSRARLDATPPRVETLLASARSIGELRQLIQSVDPAQRVLLGIDLAEAQAEVTEVRPAEEGRSSPVTTRVRQETIDEIIGMEAEVRAAALTLSETLQDGTTHRLISILARLEQRMTGGAARELAETTDRLRRFQENLEAAESRLTLSLRRLDDAVMELRVVPIGTLLSRLPRVVRAVAQASGKDVELVMEGQEVAVDRSLVEALADPLLHLVRNAVDHGIEPTAQRERLGKARRGLLRVSVARRTGQVRVSIADDGQGIDRQKVLARAVEKGLVSAVGAEAMTETAVHALLFRPGFSTAAEVTETSGRGVGLDVVQEAVRRAGGTLEVTSIPGHGSAFTLALPLTAAIQPVLLVEVAGQPYALPAGRVESVAEGGEMAGVETVDLAALLGLKAKGTGAVVMVRSGGRLLGLTVDSVQRRTDLLLRTLHPSLAAQAAIGGVGVLGNGEPVVVLEPDGIG